MPLTLLVLCFLCSTGSSVIYRPDYTPHMKNTSMRWNLKAKMSGPNVCAKEIVWASTPITFDIAWTGGTSCMPTTVKLDCCDGWSRVPGERGCTQIKELASDLATAISLHAGVTLRMFQSAGLDPFMASADDPITVLAPLDHTWSSLSAISRRYLEDGASRATRLVDAPPLLLSHVIMGRQLEKMLKNDALISPLSGQPIIRINKYPNGLVTANCVPIVNRDVTTQGALIHTLAGVLPQGYLFHIADTILRDTEARRFANFLAQSHLENQLRSSESQTLFLPSDAAIEAMSHHQTHALLYDMEGLQALVLNHITSGVHCGAMLSSARLVSKHGKALKAECRRSGIFIEGASILTSDKMATNGVVHVIDRVLVPRRAMLLLDLLTDLGLTYLASLVDRAGLTSTFLSTDSFTLFAPINAALEGVNRLSDRDARDLILNHMVPDRVFVSSLKTSENLPTKGNRPPFSIKFTRDKLLVDAAVMLLVDVEGLNGVIHIVDRVIAPPRQETVLQYLQDSGRYTQFLNALRTAGSSVYNPLVTQEAKVKKTVFAVADTDIAYSLYYRSEIVRHHVIGRALLTEEIPVNGTFVVQTVNGDEVYLTRRPGSLYAGSAPVLARDIICSDGVIHTLREVMMDPKRSWGYHYSQRQHE